ncbi:hypothetical protein BG015_000003 [Linnemannia schmuckeri]|uniref:Zn(2)-C6 fungal-type domain-containing protein n=1 Tax=Linnemannia schmuckeri TaxID=64567 RepID=A0A9P5S7H4_9FUNG|nr:hypothetical protein BG015_000003 [Linnemannia schmuckeri]
MFSAPMLLDFNNNSKRSKITKACDNCRRRRVKCDGTPDGCGGCKAAKTQCVYTTSNTKRGPPKGYVEVIEDRLGKIENMLAGIVKKKKSPSTPVNNNDIATAGASSDNDDNDNDDNDDIDNDNDNDNTSIASIDLVEVKRQPPASPTLRGRSGSTATTVGPLSNGSGARHSPLVSRNRSLTSLLPFSQESQLQHHMEAQANYPGPVSQADIAALTDMFEKLGTTSVRTTVPFPWLTPEQSQHYGRNYLQFTAQSLEPPLPSMTRSFSPSLSSDALLDLLNSFFDSFNNFLPLLYRPTFMKQWDRQTCQFCFPNYHHHHLNKKHTQPQPHEAEAHKAHLQDPVAPLSPLLLNALLAIASMIPSSSKTASQSLETSQGYFDAARLLLDDFLDVPRVSTVQALCLMSQFHHQGQWKATRSSGYLSLAIRMAHELGLNRDPEVTSRPEADALRYLWWSMFILDHQFSAWLGLGLLMHGKESNVELPMDVQQDLRGFICLVRLVKILGSVLQHSYSTQSLPPQFGGHDSMVSYIEGSLTSWLSNLSPEMRWLHPNNSNGRRGSPASPMRSPDAIRAAAGLDRANGDIYPAYLYIVYNTTLILLHRPYIVGAAGSPTAAQSNTICTGSGRAITDIAQGLEIARCSYVVNRFALYALLQAGVIHAMNAVYDKRGTEVAMEYYTRTIKILESFLSCAAYSGGVAEGIKILEQFLATTSKAAAEEEGVNGGVDHVSTIQLDQAPTQPYRKKRQLDSVSSQSGSISTQSSIQYQPSVYAVPMQTTAFAQQPILTPTLSMMTSPELMNGTAYAFDYNNNQLQQQQTPVTVSDLKEQQKQQQLKIQQQHRLYQMQTFGSGGAGAVKVEPNTDSLDLHKVEQQQQLQQQLLRQQLQRQQQQQQVEMSMKGQIAVPSTHGNSGSVHPSTLSAQSPNLAAPVIPSHRHALQMLQQQQQQQQHQHSFQHNQQLRQQHQQPVTMPLTMTMTSLSMEAQQKMTQDFQLSNMIATSAGYDPSQFWMDFSGGASTDPGDRASAGGLMSVGLEQERLRIATTVAGEGQFGGNSSLWI